MKAVADDEALIGSSMLPLDCPERFYVVPLRAIKNVSLFRLSTLTSFKADEFIHRNLGHSKKSCSSRSLPCLEIPSRLQDTTAISINTDCI